MKKTPKLAAFANVLLIVALVVLILTLVGPRMRRPEKPLPQTVQRQTFVAVATVRARAITDRITFPGTVRPITEVKLASEVGGKVAWLGIKEGQQVQVKAPVVRLSAADKEASLALATAELKLADKEKERAERLFQQKTISQAELDQAVSRRDVAKAREQLARAELAKMSISSPIAGFVNTVPVEEGEYVNAGDTVAEILVLDHVEVYVDVPEKDIADVKPGAEVWVYFDFLEGNGTGGEAETADAGAAPPVGFRNIRKGSLKLRGKITFIAYASDPVARTYTVKVLLPNPRGVLRSGMIARVAVVKNHFPEAVAVPLFAIIPQPDGRHVLFVEENGVARRRAVTLGVNEEGWIQVTEGLKIGERAIIEGQNAVDDGDPVVVVILDGRRVPQ